MNRLLVVALTVFAAALYLGCSSTAPQTIVGTYVQIHGPVRYVLELKPDKTATYTRQEVGAPPSPEGFGDKPASGTYEENGDTVKVHLAGGRLAELAGQPTQDWVFRKDAGVLIQQPEGKRFFLETETSKANDNTAAKLLPELTPDKAQLALDEWAVPKLDSFKEMILRRSLTANEKTTGGANTVVLVTGGHAIKTDGWRHIAKVDVTFNNIPIESTPPRPPGLSATEILNYESRRSEMPKTVTLYSGPGIATFWHDTDGKWFLVSLGRTNANNPPGEEVTWPIARVIEVKF